MSYACIYSAILTLICNTNATLCAGCPDNVVITMPDGPPYTADDLLTCSSDGYPAATYAWTVDGTTASSTSTQALEEDAHEYVCTATVTFDNGDTCFGSDTRTITAYSKYQNYCNNSDIINYVSRITVIL